MLGKLVLAAGLAVSAAGCASVGQSGGRSPVATTAGGLQIRGELIDLTEVKILVNGDKIIDEQLAPLTGEGKFASSYQGRRVQSDCSTAAGMALSKTECLVSVGDEPAVLLKF
jgi:hypothetical protein